MKMNQIEKDGILWPHEADFLAIVPEIGADGTNGSRIHTVSGSLYLPYRVNYILETYARERGESIALLKRMTPHGQSARQTPRNAILRIAPWLVLVPTQTRRQGIARGTTAYINASRPVTIEPAEGGEAKSAYCLQTGTRIPTLWTAERNELHLREGEYHYTHTLLYLSARIQEEHRTYLLSRKIG